VLASSERDLMHANPGTFQRRGLIFNLGGPSSTKALAYTSGMIGDSTEGETVNSLVEGWIKSIPIS